MSRTSRALAWALLFLSTVSAAAEVFPAHPIRILVPYAPGGSTDQLARIVGQRLAEIWSQPVVIENKPGADTQIAMTALANSAPDGYTLGMVTASLAVNKTLYPNTSYDATRDFVPIAMLGGSDTVLIVNPRAPFKDFGQFLAYAKANPGKLNYSTSSSIAYLMTERFNRRFGISAVNVSYKGSVPSTAAVIAGDVDFSLDTVMATKALIEAGRLAGLVVLSDRRQPSLPNLPTLADVGVTDYEFLAWSGLAGPRGVPADIVAKINADVRSALNDAQTRHKVEQLGGMTVSQSVDALNARISDEMAAFETEIKRNKMAINK